MSHAAVLISAAYTKALHLRMQCFFTCKEGAPTSCPSATCFGWQTITRSRRIISWGGRISPDPPPPACNPLRLLLNCRKREALSLSNRGSPARLPGRRASKKGIPYIFIQRRLLFEKNKQSNGDCRLTGRFAEYNPRQTSPSCSQQASGG